MSSVTNPDVDANESRRHAIIEGWNAGLTLEAIGRPFGMSCSLVRYWLIRAGVHVYDRRRVPDATRDLAVELYQSGLNATEVGDRLHLTSAMIGYILEDRGIETRCGNNLPINAAAFANAENDEDAAYWVGFLMADGCVTQPKRRTSHANIHAKSIILGLATRDGDHLRKYKAFLKSEHKIEIAATSMRLCFASDKMADDLARYGVVERKSHTAKVSLLENNRHFWRGVVDGDGCVCMYRQKKCTFPAIEVCGSRNLMDQFATYVNATIPHAARKVVKHSKIWRVRCYCAVAAALAKELYSNCRTFLDRKNERALEVMQWRKAKPKQTVFSDCC